MKGKLICQHYLTCSNEGCLCKIPHEERINYCKKQTKCFYGSKDKGFPAECRRVTLADLALLYY